SNMHSLWGRVYNGQKIIVREPFKPRAASLERHSFSCAIKPTSLDGFSRRGNSVPKIARDAKSLAAGAATQSPVRRRAAFPVPWLHSGRQWRFRLDRPQAAA